MAELIPILYNGVTCDSDLTERFSDNTDNARAGGQRPMYTPSKVHRK